MITTYDLIMLFTLIISCIFLTFLLNFLNKKKKNTSLIAIFKIIFGLILFWMIDAILQIICTSLFDINPLLFVNSAYFSICFLPVAFFFMALIFTKTKITFRPIYCLLFVIPKV